MPKAIPEGLTQQHVLLALRDLDEGIEHGFKKAVHYELVYEGRCYPPKAVVGVAFRHLTGSILTPEEFSGGEATGQANGVLRNLGFTIRRKSDKQNAFVFRIAPSGIDRLQTAIESDTLIIGWGKLPQLLDDSLDQDDFRQIVHDEYFPDDEFNRSAGSAAGKLWSFIRTMKVGDLVLVPHGTDDFYICEVTGNAFHDETKVDEDTAFRRAVNWLHAKKPLSRPTASEPLQRLLKSRPMCVDATEHLDEIEQIIEQTGDGRIGVSELRYRDGSYTQKLRETALKSQDEGYFEPATLEDERERKVTEVVQRRGQYDFRNRLLAAYNGRCAITDCDAEQALEAAHIVPYTGPKSNHVSNGLLLRADIHTLFDLDLIGIDPESLRIVVAEQLHETCYEELDGQELIASADPAYAPNKEALQGRWEKFQS